MGIKLPALILPALALSSALLASSIANAQVQLPSLGDRISGLISLDDEYALGREFMRSVRRSSVTISDPLLNDYLVNVTHNLALHSELKDYRLSFIIIDSPDLNAFAAPGGIIGVNGGLFLNAHTEGEFLSVMSHELAHVSQRHFARSVEDAQRRRIPELATLLASIVVMGTSGAGQGQAAIMAAQGHAVENQLRFSRNNEAEADRVGIRTLYDAGYNPEEMPAMFERLMGLNRFGARPPEFLLSHPVTEARIADTRGRAARYPAQESTPSLEYQLMRSRIQIHYETLPQTSITHFKTELSNGITGAEKAAAQYGLALAYMQNKQYNEAHETLELLLADDPNRIAYVVAKAEIFTASNEAGRAQQFLQRPLQISPDNHPLTITYADALIADRKYEEAAKVLEKHVTSRPEDHDLWYAIAETQGLVGDVSKVHQARAEYFILTGDFKSASEQLSYAQRIESDKENNGPLIAKLRQRARDVEMLDRNSRGR